MRREKRNGCIAPVVRLARWAVLRIELEYRQQLHCSDTEIFEVRNFFDQSSVCPAFLGRDARAGMTRKAAHMQLVKHGLNKGPLERQIALPIVATGICYDAFHRHGGIVAPARRGPA